VTNVVKFGGGDETKFVGLLGRGDKRQVLANTANALILLDLDPGLKGLLAFDELFARGVITRSPPPWIEGEPGAEGPYPRPWDNTDVQMILAYLQRVWTNAFSQRVVENALIAVAMAHRYHPVRDYLGRLKWDGVKRLDTWLMRAFGTPKSDYTKAVGAKFMIAAVRRVRVPGCKFDHLPIFEGLQGLGKSQSVGVLFGGDWFSDSLPHDLASRDSVMALQGIWGGEFPEIDQIIRADIETVKAFLSRAIDRYRVPYGRGFIEVARQCVLCGTSNSVDYLRDVSGNRRFWPIECLFANIAWIIENRDQLWAEAAIREEKGETLWFDDEEIAKAAVTMQASRMSEDTWEDVLKSWLRLNSTMECTTADALWHGLSVPRERQDRKAILRVCNCLRKIGWQQVVEGRVGTGRRVWKPINRETWETGE
jgi:predicted P-loop ATPase